MLVSGFAVAALVLAGHAVGVEGPNIVRVEEDWVVEFGVPDPDNNAPQVTTVMSPVGGTDGVYMVFDLNHQSLPEYDAGGMQLQVWNGEEPLTFGGFPNANVLSMENDVATFTSRLEVANGKMWFEVVNGSSQTWGSFGGGGHLRHAVDTTLTSLGSYSPAQSVANSRVGFAKHRVRKLALREVRYYTASGLHSTDSTERVVHVHDPEPE